MKKTARETKPQANDAASSYLLISFDGEVCEERRVVVGLVVSSSRKAVRTPHEMIGGSKYFGRNSPTALWILLTLATALAKWGRTRSANRVRFMLLRSKRRPPSSSSRVL